MKKALRLPLLTALLVTPFVQGCLNLDFGGDKPVQKPTLGQELSDLHRARLGGAITEEEYRSLRDRLIRAH